MSDEPREVILTLIGDSLARYGAYTLVASDAPSIAEVQAEIARLRAEVARLEQLVCDFQAASGLITRGGDPDGITPDHVEKSIVRLLDDAESMKAENAWLKYTMADDSYELALWRKDASARNATIAFRPDARRSMFESLREIDPRTFGHVAPECPESLAEFTAALADTADKPQTGE